MSSKIDGVPRELLERLQSQTELSNDWDEVQALLAAPVVERQPEPVAYLDIGAGGYMDLGSDLTDEQLQALPNGRHMLGILGTFGVDGWEPALIFSAGKTDPVAYATFYDCGDIKVWSRSAKVVEDIVRHGEKAIPLYTAPPELAELQAIISRLTADVETMRAKNNELNDTVERLKGGQGEAVAWIIQRGSIIEGMTGQRSVQLDRPSNECIRAHDVEPLFTSQPAPVAVVLPTREVMRDLIAEVIGGDAYDCTRVWSAWGVGTMSEDDFVPLVEQEERLYELADACLDKVKELNQ